MKNYPILSILFALTLITGCAAKRPILYDNALYKKDPAKGEAAVEECMKRAEAKGLKGDKLADATEKAAKGGVASAASGAAGAAAANGVVGHRYSVGGSAAASAASGFAGNMALGLMDDSVDPAVDSYVQHCLAEKGYKIVAWK